jgi:3-dehydroquinate synthetase
LQPADIPVEWEIEEPPLTPRTWHRWTDREAAEATEITDESLDDRLGWPRGTSGALVAGFERQLSRATGWESDDVEFGPAARAAAMVYKRGVAFRPNDETPFHSRRRQGLYSIGIQTDAPDFARLIGPGELPIVDSNVLRGWPAIPTSVRQLAMTLDEHEKNLQSVALVLDTWRASGRPSSWVVVGGGLLADVAAFAAALAGAEVRFVPTTLLAMADACVGGKTGVNFAPYGKNQVGAFHFPWAVDVWTGWLATLPQRQLAAGAAECVKHALLCGDLELGKAIAAATGKGQLAALTPLLPRIIKVKSDVVAEDPGEAGKRAVLNLGHTLAHALEAMAHERTTGETTILHGEAVGVGIAYALLLSRDVAGLAPGELEAMIDLLRQAGTLPTTTDLARRIGVPSATEDEVFDALWALAAHDKKNLGGDDQIGFVLLKAPGVVARGTAGQWTLPVSRDAARETWDELLTRLM